MIAVDTNILVYAHREETTKHELAKRWLFYLAEGNVPWGLPVFCIGEYIRVITHRSVFDPPSSLQDAVDGIEFLLQSPSIRLLDPGVRFFHHLKETLLVSETTGNLTFDAQIAALCKEHGIVNLLTDDRDFSRFPGIRIVTPEADMRAW